jgi:hypothetical protein
MTSLFVWLILALASPVLAGETGKATSPPQRTLIRSVPAGNVYVYENAAGETVEEMENRQGHLRRSAVWSVLSVSSVWSRC